MTTGIIASILLLIRIVASVFLWKVLKIQVDLLRRPIKVDEAMYNEQDIVDVWNFRKFLHYTTIALFVGNFIPIILDALVVLQWFGVFDGFRTRPVLIIYAISNAVTMLLAAILINSIYKLAVETKEVTDLEIEHLRNKHKK